MDNELKQHLTEKSLWLRALYMLLFIFIFWLVEVVLIAVVILQFLLKLFTGNSNRYLLEFGRDLSRYAYQIFLYLTFNRDHTHGCQQKENQKEICGKKRKIGLCWKPRTLRKPMQACGLFLLDKLQGIAIRVAAEQGSSSRAAQRVVDVRLLQRLLQ